MDGTFTYLSTAVRMPCCRIGLRSTSNKQGTMALKLDHTVSGPSIPALDFVGTVGKFETVATRPEPESGCVFSPSLR